MPTLALTTEVEAVNIMLRAIGEQPVESIIGSVGPAVVAQQTLHELSRQIQSQGLYCNTEEKVELIVDANNKIAVPSTALAIDAYDTTIQVSVRGSFLYDVKNRTFDLSQYSPLKCNITYFLAYEDLPETLRRYLALRAAREFAFYQLGAVDRVASLETEMIEAKAAFMRDELNNRDAHPFGQNYSTASVVGRRSLSVL